jgi:pimeloyl-ACP methyl ester carboxylesterase
MVLETQGVFWAGGQIVDRTDPALTGNKTLLGAAYVEYFIPHKKRKNAVPVIMTHSSISGVVFQTTGDGREGWVQYFVRQGFPVYVVDPPGIGRAGFDVDQANLAATGQIPPLSSNPLARGGSESWPRWNIGPEFGELGDGTTGGTGNQMSIEPGALRRFLAAQMPSGPSPAPGGSEAAFIALLEKTGPAIFIGWSGGGGLGETLVKLRPDLFQALISLEATGSCTPNPGGTPPAVVDPALVDVLVDNQVPFLNVNGTTGHSNRNPGGLAPFVCQALIDQIIAAGGDATQIQLPDLGIVGDSHMYFWENHSDQIAQIVVDWIADHVKHDDDDHKGRPGGKHDDDDHKGRHGSKHAER